MYELESQADKRPHDGRIAGLRLNVLEMISLVSAAGCLFLKPDIDIRLISGWLVATVIASRIARHLGVPSRNEESPRAAA